MDGAAARSANPSGDSAAVDTQSKAHPRRPPAHKSVSLLHASRTNNPQLDDSIQAQADGAKKQGQTSVGNRANLNPISSSLPAVPDKSGSSGESSNADKWFEKSNNNPRSGSADLMDSKNDRSMQVGTMSWANLRQMIRLSSSAIRRRPRHHRLCSSVSARSRAPWGLCIVVRA